MIDFKTLTVGEIVAKNIAYANIFQSYGIDFCCGGDVLLADACKQQHLSLDEIVRALESNNKSFLSQSLDFDAWSLDLLIDYIVKYHHHYIRSRGGEIFQLLDKVCKAHGDADKHLYEVRSLFEHSLIDLHSHLDKEENILFPYVEAILHAKKTNTALPEFHCGSVENPIRVMIQEHDDEGARFKEISRLTNGYEVPTHACNSYKLLMHDLFLFEETLHIHIHVENNILFPKSIELQEEINEL